MRSKISTLLAATLVAGAFSSNAWADNVLTTSSTKITGPNASGVAVYSADAADATQVTLPQFKSGDNVYLVNGKTVAVGSQSGGHPSSSELYVSAEGTYMYYDVDTKTVKTMDEPATVAAAKKCLWTVTVSSVAGTTEKQYTFTHKASGAVLSLDRTKTSTSEFGGTNVSGQAKTAKEKAVMATGANAIDKWSWDKDSGVLYYYQSNDQSTVNKKDSVLFLTPKKGEATTVGLGAAYWETDFETTVGNSALAFTNWALSPISITTAAAANAAFGDAADAKTFKLFFNTKDVSSDQTNVFTGKDLKAVKIQGTETAFAIQAGETDAYADNDKDKVKKPLLIVADTFTFAGSANKMVKFGTDTLKKVIAESADATPAPRRALKTYLFTADYDVMKDSLSLKVQAIPFYQATVCAKAGDTKTGQEFEGSHWGKIESESGVASLADATNANFAADGAPFFIGTQSLEKVTVLTPIVATTTATDNILPRIQIKKTFPVGGEVSFTDAELNQIYFVKNVSKVENDGKFIVYPYGTTVAYAAAGSDYVPSTQWVLVANAGKGYYTLTNREYQTTTISGAFNYVDKDNKVYACGTDTFQIVAAGEAANANAFVGYKNVTAFDQANKLFVVNSGSKFMKGLGFVMESDSTLKLAENGIDFILTQSAAAAKFADKIGDAKELKNQAYTLKNAKGEFIQIKDNNVVVLTKKGDATAFYIKNMVSDSSYVLVNAAGSKKLSVNAQTTKVEAVDLTADENLFVVKEKEAPQSYVSKPVHRTITDGVNFIAMGDDKFGYAVREGDLKSEVYDQDALAMWVDTAKYERNNVKEVTPQYYVAKGGNYMVALADSAKDDYNYAGKRRIAFMEATKAGVDTLLVKSFAGKTDSVCLAAEAKKGQKGGLDNFRFTFTLDDAEVEGVYVIKSASGYKVVNVNGILVADKEAVNPMLVELKAANAPVGNEAIDAATVKVVAGEGNVTVYGAAGKKVVVSDVLGRTTTVVATSDSQTVAVASGVAIVAVEGEAAVKAVVK